MYILVVCVCLHCETLHIYSYNTYTFINTRRVHYHNLLVRWIAAICRQLLHLSRHHSTDHLHCHVHWLFGERGVAVQTSGQCSGPADIDHSAAVR